MLKQTEKVSHIPVLLREVLEAAQPVLERLSDQEPRYLDVTLGRGGHLSAIAALHPKLTAYGLDRDDDALAAVQKSHAEMISQGRLHLHRLNFMLDELPSELGNFDLILADLGVSSPQLDEPHRGFSFYHDGPLDMRMDTSRGLTAADILRDWDEDDLFELFKTYGEIRNPARVVRALVHDRKSTPFETTRQLASLIERVEGWSRKGFHPATTYFLALRLKVNEEIEPLEKGIMKLIERLKPGGRLMLITFHSLEDRIAKYAIREHALGEPVKRKVIAPSREEVEENPRSRSAKLRIFERHLEALPSS